MELPPVPDLTPFRLQAEALEAGAAAPDFFADRRRAEADLRELQRLRSLLGAAGERQTELVRRDEARRLAEDPSVDAELRELARADAEEAEHRAASLHRRIFELLMPPEPLEERGTVMEIRAGTGGAEASLFAAELFRMYMRFIERRGWKTEVLSSSVSEAGGYKEVIFAVQGEGAFKVLRHESGVHRVQRVPVTEASGRIHTSTVTVAVLPEAGEVDVQLHPQDLEITVSRASGPGGQGVNTTDSAVQILHKPTGLIVFCADERSQLKNRAKALSVLRARLLQRKQDEERQREAEARRDQIGLAQRSDKVRTYNFPQNRVTDHRVNLTLHNLPEVLEGALDELVEALQKDAFERRLAALLGGQER